MCPYKKQYWTHWQLLFEGAKKKQKKTKKKQSKIKTHNKKQNQNKIKTKQTNQNKINEIINVQSY